MHATVNMLWKNQTCTGIVPDVMAKKTWRGHPTHNEKTDLPQQLRKGEGRIENIWKKTLHRAVNLYIIKYVENFSRFLKSSIWKIPCPFSLKFWPRSTARLCGYGRSILHSTVRSPDRPSPPNLFGLLFFSLDFLWFIQYSTRISKWINFFL